VVFKTLAHSVLVLKGAPSTKQFWLSVDGDANLVISYTHIGDTLLLVCIALIHLLLPRPSGILVVLVVIFTSLNGRLLLEILE
jgi:hypothetical protein